MTPSNACATTVGFPNVPQLLLGGIVRTFAIADFDEDSKRDVLVMVGNEIEIAKGRGDGTFDAPYTIASTTDGIGGEVIAAADMTGDHRVDVVYRGFDDTSLHVLKNNGGLVFATQVAYDMTIVADQIALVDVNGDARRDLVAFSKSSHVIAVRLANNDGFAAVMTYQAAADNIEAARFAVGDVNGDTKPDVVVTTLLAKGFNVLLNDGSGAFGTPTFHETVAPTFDVVLADVSGDGVNDILVTHDSNLATYGLLVNNGTGMFSSEQTVKLTEISALPYLAVDDIDGDHDLDVVIASGGGAGGAVIIEGVTPSMSGVTTRYAAPTAQHLELADVNGDYKPDILIASASEISTLLRKSTTPWYETRAGYSVVFAESVSSQRFIEIDNEPGPEVVSAYTRSGEPNGSLEIRSDRSGYYNIGTRSVMETQGRPRLTLTADVNGDMRTDLVVVGETATGFVAQAFLNRDGALTAAPAFSITSGPLQIQTADVDEDGKLDLVVASSSTVDLRLGRGDGTFAAATQLWSATAATLQGCVFGDFDNDGHVDFIVAEATPAFEFHRGLGGGHFALPVFPTTPTKVGKLDARDLDNDGRLDLIEHSSTTPLAVRLGHGDGSFGDRLESDVRTESEVALADVNGDDHLDVLATSTQSLAVMLGNGDGTLQPALFFDAGEQPTSLSIADIDGDGRLDVATNSTIESSRRTYDVSVLRGRCLP